MKKILTLACVALFAAFVSVAAAQNAPKSPANVKHIVWIGADGFGSHYVKWDELPNLSKMRDGGSWTLHMRSVLPSSSAINWHTMMVGAPSEMHGYRNWNSKKPEIEPVYVNDRGYFPDFFRVMKDAIPGFTARAVFNWDGIGFCYDNDAVDESIYLSADNVEASDELVIAKGLELLDKKSTFTFIYFDDPDHIGHSIGWGTPEYQQKMTKIDEYVGRVLDKLEKSGMMEDTVVYFSSDHGGSDKGHGEARLDHMEAPFIIYGKGIKQGEITDSFANFDCASTILAVLGVKQPQCWRGKPANVIEVK